MCFLVFENKKHSYAKIHKADCACYKNGNRSKDCNSSIWHGPFKTYAEAMATASKIRRYVDCCKLCKPEMSE